MVPLSEIAHEEAETAKKAGRKQFQEMLKFIDTNTDCKNILVEKTDRLYRNFYDHVALDIDRRLLKIHLVKEGQVLSKDSKSHEKLVHDVKLVLSNAKFHPTGTTRFQMLGTMRFHESGTTQFHASGTT